MMSRGEVLRSSRGEICGSNSAGDFAREGGGAGHESGATPCTGSSFLLGMAARQTTVDDLAQRPRWYKKSRRNGKKTQNIKRKH
jgi:hypothetical protein